MENELIELTVPDNFDKVRVDRFLTEYSELEFSRSFIQKLIKRGNVSVDGAHVKPNHKLAENQVVTITVPEPEKLELLAQDIPLDIVYQDSDLVIINKQAGLVVHPGPGNPDKTLVNALLYHIKDLSSIGGVERPGIVHRLDRDTSGLIIVAKNDKAHKHLSSLFANSDIKKVYYAITSGMASSSHFFVEKPIARHPKYRQKMTVLEGGRHAKTEVTVEKRWNLEGKIFSLCKIRIYTGRTHQIRVHLSHEKMPVVGDPIYSKSAGKFKVPYLLLAAMKLEFTHPSNNKTMTFEIELPKHMQDFINLLDRKCNATNEL